MASTTITVYCSSSDRIPAHYLDDAARLGRLLAGNGVHVVYGGGKAGSMGRLADAAMAAGGDVTGFIPKFMKDVEWAHEGITKLVVVGDMAERKRLLMADSDALIALPGGTGTLEELYEAVTAKRLGLFTGPILLVNSGGFYDPLIAMLKRAIDEHFMDPRHADLWTVIGGVDEVFDGLARAPKWGADAITFAAPRKPGA